VRSWSQRAFGWVSLALVALAAASLVAWLLPESWPPAIVVVPGLAATGVLGWWLLGVVRRRLFLIRIVRPVEAAMAAGTHARAIDTLTLTIPSLRRRPVPEAQYICHTLALAHVARGEHVRALDALRKLASLSPELPQEALRLWLDVAIAAGDEAAARECLAWPDPATMDADQKEEHRAAERRIDAAFARPP
jgi:hypothetical protein